MNLTRLGILLAATAVAGQSQTVATNPRSEFEVATIKPTANYDGRSFVQVLPGGGLRTSGATLKGLIASAYQGAVVSNFGRPRLDRLGPFRCRRQG